MGQINSHRDLRVWQLAFELGMEVQIVCDSFPQNQQFALAFQLRRSAISVPSNIGEGYGRGSKMDYLRFLKIARGSLFEMDTQLLFARDLRYLQASQYEELFSKWNDVSRMLAGLIASLENHTS